MADSKPSLAIHPQPDHLVFFDGVCNFCNASINFIMKHDKNGQFRFAPLQSDLAKKKLPHFGIDPGNMETFVLLESEQVYTRSTAALRIARKLNGLWPLLYGLIIVPPFIRNFVYDFVARNRYRWFGKMESCRVPTAEERSRFVDAL